MRGTIEVLFLYLFLTKGLMWSRIKVLYFFLSIEVLYLFLARGSTMRGTIEVLFFYLFLTAGLTMRSTIDVL